MSRGSSACASITASARKPTRSSGGLPANVAGLRAVCRYLFAEFALGARRIAELAAVTLGEMRRRLEAAGRRDVHDRHRGLQQQLACAAQAHLQVETLRHDVEVALEQPFDLAARQARGLRDLVQR